MIDIFHGKMDRNSHHCKMDANQNRNPPPPPPPAPIYNKIKRTDSRLNEWSTNLHCFTRNNQTHKSKKTTEMWTRYASFIIRLIWNRFACKLQQYMEKRRSSFWTITCVDSCRRHICVQLHTDAHRRTHPTARQLRGEWVPAVGRRVSLQTVRNTLELRSTNLTLIIS